jgi:outer membrane lipoprotein-sorting protein
MKKPITANNSKVKKFINYAKFFLICVVFFVTSKNSFSQNNSTNSSNKNSFSEDLVKIENYLNSIKFISAKFVQNNSEGEKAMGKFYLKRPGKMRVEYDGEEKILIIVNNSVLAYKDVELDETSYLTTNSTPASLLTRENISFSAKDIEVKSIEKKANSINISIYKKNRKEAGLFTLTFLLDPIQFIKMEIKDDVGQINNITFLDPDFKSPISENLFIIKNKNIVQTNEF